MPLYCKWLIKEKCFSEAAEALFTREGNHLGTAEFLCKR